MNHSLNGRTRWQETQPTVTKTCTTIIIRIMVILLKIAGTCGTIWNSWSEKGGLKHLLHHSSGRRGQTGSAFQENAASKPPLGTINVIFAASGRTESCPSRIKLVSCYSDDESNSVPNRIKTNIPLMLSFSDADK